MKNLETELKNVWSATDLSSKVEAMTSLINESHAKKATKEKALRDIARMSSKQIDKFAVNYMMSGEGMGVK
jgi:hypothetical protein